MASTARSSSAAFFDLDRTLLAGASGPVISKALRTAGVLSDKAIPGEQLMTRIFNSYGETLPAMALTRTAVNFAKGWPLASVRKAAAAAAPELLSIVQPRVAELFAEHRAAGRPIVLATTSPFELVKPLADLLGMDDVIATRYGVDDSGLFDGSIDGRFVWSKGKLDAVRDWAAAAGVSLADSFAYSDSVFDVPLLSAVGHAFAVNPDPNLRVVALARRWPQLSLGDPKGTIPSLAGISLQRILLELAKLPVTPYARFSVSGESHVPTEGAAILVGNHRSYFDPLAMGMLLSKVGRTARFLGKKEVFDAPLVGQLASLMGGIRVERGTGSDEPLKRAVVALEAGEIVGLMPEGTIPRGLAFFDPVLVGRWGAARLAAMTGAPVIPVGIWGTEHVWPRNAKIPNVMAVANPPLVTINVGEPVEIKGRSADADTKRIMKAISALLPAESRTKRTPTDDELRRTFPSSYTGDLRATGEAARRPGTD